MVVRKSKSSGVVQSCMYVVDNTRSNVAVKDWMCVVKQKV